jgi:uncharacterized protein YecT (DUF1311 family)
MFLLIRLSAFAGALLVASAGVSGTDLECGQAFSTPDLRECTAKALTDADAKLNALYAQALSYQDDVGREKLVKAQRAWIKLRDADAEFVSDINRGGTSEPLTYLASKLESTVSRVTWFEQYLEIFDN